MYKIKNNTNGKLLINDLGIKLSGGETIDLDSKFSRDAIEASHHLRVAEVKEFITVLHKDVVHEVNSIDPHVIQDMENRIRQTILDEMRNNAPKDSGIGELTSKMDSLLEAIKNQPQVVQTVTQPSQDADNSLADDTSQKLVEVHAKALRRIAGTATGHVEAQHNVVESDISKNADELDNILD